MGFQAHRRKQMKQHVPEDAPCKTLEEEFNDVAHQQLHKQYLQSLTLHPHYKEIMHEHQLDGFHFLERNKTGDESGDCILAHAPGTGKTFLVIAFVQSFLQAFPDERVMIMAAKGMLLPWVKEFMKWKVEEKVLVFSQFKSPLSFLINMFQNLWNWNENVQMLRIDGNLSAEDREKGINKSNNDSKAWVLLASIKACGEGVCLTGASRVKRLR